MKEFKPRSGVTSPSAVPQFSNRGIGEKDASEGLHSESTAKEPPGEKAQERPFTFPYHFIHRFSRLFRAN